jgi:hypothetical protein
MPFTPKPMYQVSKGVQAPDGIRMGARHPRQTAPQSHLSPNVAPQSPAIGAIDKLPQFDGGGEGFGQTFAMQQAEKDAINPINALFEKPVHKARNQGR